VPLERLRHVHPKAPDGVVSYVDTRIRASRVRHVDGRVRRDVSERHVEVLPVEGLDARLTISTFSADTAYPRSWASRSAAARAWSMSAYCVLRWTSPLRQVVALA
jgi:hypothetical protein